MKAMRFHEFGGPDVLRYEEIEEPTPDAGEVRIRVAATMWRDFKHSVGASWRPSGPTRNSTTGPSSTGVSEHGRSGR